VVTTYVVAYACRYSFDHPDFCPLSNKVDSRNPHTTSEHPQDRNGIKQGETVRDAAHSLHPTLKTQVLKLTVIF